MKSAFLSPLRVEQISEKGSGAWQLTAPLRYASKLLGGIVVVETGFVTDFASVPRLPVFWWLAGGTTDKEAVIHDLLTQCKGISWEMAADVYLECMESTGVPWWRRKPMYGFVMAWGKVRPRKENKITLKLERLDSYT